MNPKVGVRKYQISLEWNIFCLQKVECFSTQKYPLINQKMYAVACAQIACQMLPLQMNTLYLYITTRSIEKYEVDSIWSC